MCQPLCAARVAVRPMVCDVQVPRTNEDGARGQLRPSNTAVTAARGAVVKTEGHYRHWMRERSY